MDLTEKEIKVLIKTFRDDGPSLVKALLNHPDYYGLTKEEMETFITKIKPNQKGA